MNSSGHPVYTEDVAKTVRCCGPDDCGKRGAVEIDGLMGRVCAGAGCMAWRWKPLMADAAFAEAVKKVHDKCPEGPITHAKAVAHVMAHKADYGLPTVPYLGYCGLAGGFLT